MLRRLAVATALVFVAVGALAGPAWAHTELEPAEATAGATELLTFHVAYEGAGTTGLEVQIPDGATVVDVPAKAGWTSDTNEADRTVTWTGGPVEADETFDVEVTLPTTPGVVLFPAIQRTTDGEVAWIDPEEDEGHDSFPAPRISLIADPSATTSTTAAPTTTSTTETPTTTTADRPDTTVEAANEGDGDSAAPWLIGAGIAALVAIALGGWFLKKRADADQATGGPAVDRPDGASPPDPSAETGSDDGAEGPPT
jgi:uncharacterized protein YcnI